MLSKFHFFKKLEFAGRSVTLKVIMPCGIINQALKACGVETLRHKAKQIKLILKLSATACYEILFFEILGAHFYFSTKTGHV